MERRDFVKQTCTLCVAVGAGLVVGSLSSCATAIPVYKAISVNNKITVPASLFATADFQIIQAKDLYYNIGLRKEKDGQYLALLLRCTHADNQLVTTGNGYKCNLHGSAFDQDGHVVTGPADRALTKYLTELVDNQIIIHINN